MKKHKKLLEKKLKKLREVVIHHEMYKNNKTKCK